MGEGADKEPVGLRLGLVPPPPRPAQSAHTPSCHLAALLGHSAPLLWRQLWGSCSWVIIANIHPASCPPWRAGERAARARAAPPHTPGGRTLAWHGAHPRYRGEESMQAARADRPAAPAEGQETLNFPSTPHLWPTLGADQPAWNLFFLATNIHTTYKNNQRGLLCSKRILLVLFWGSESQ